MVHLGLSSQNGDAEYWATKDDGGAARGVGEKGMGGSLLWGGVDVGAPFWVICFLRLEVYRLLTGMSWDEATSSRWPSAVTRFIPAQPIA